MRQKYHYFVGPWSHSGVSSPDEFHVRVFSQHAAPVLVTKEMTHARSCARRSTHSIAILAMPDRVVAVVLSQYTRVADDIRQTGDKQIKGHCKPK